MPLMSNIYLLPDFENLERYRMCGSRITCASNNGRKSVRRPFGRNGFNLEKHIYKKKMPTRGVKARLSPINMKHDSQPQSLHLMTKGISISVMMNSINIHIIRCFFD